MTNRNNNDLNRCKNAEELIETIKTRQKERNRRAFKIKVLVILCVISTIFLIATVYAKNAKETKPVVYKTIEIEFGDTLWDLAQEYYPDTDVRDAIYKIKKINGMKNSFLYEGQIIKVPENNND